MDTGVDAESNRCRCSVMHETDAQTHSPVTAQGRNQLIFRGEQNSVYLLLHYFRGGNVECEASPPHKPKEPRTNPKNPAETQSPAIENFLATVLAWV